MIDGSRAIWKEQVVLRVRRRRVMKNFLKTVNGSHSFQALRERYRFRVLNDRRELSTYSPEVPQIILNGHKYKFTRQSVVRTLVSQNDPGMLRSSSITFRIQDKRYRQTEIVS